MAQLSSKLPAEEAKWLTTGFKEPKEARRLLEERYRDRHIAILSTMHKLESIKLPQGPAHDKVEALVLAVRTENMCLIIIIIIILFHRATSNKMDKLGVPES